MEHGKNDPSQDEQKEISERLKLVAHAHDLYRWAYSLIAEGIELSTEDVVHYIGESMDDVPENRVAEIIKLAYQETEDDRKDLVAGLSGEDREKQTLLHQNVWLTLNQAGLDYMAEKEE